MRLGIDIGSHVFWNAAPALVAVTYDNRFGTATSATGWFTFGLNSGNRRIWVDSVNGLDTNNGLTAGAAVQTLDHALALFVGAGFTSGDQLMIAGAQGQTYTDNFANGDFSVKGGISNTYPTAILSYDSTAPSNSSLYGQLTGSKRPYINLPGNSSFSQVGSGAPKGFVAIQGLVITGTKATGGQGISFMDRRDGVCFQNCILKYVGLTIDASTSITGRAQQGNLSKCALIGAWIASTAHTGGLYSDNYEALWDQDCIYIHSGWKISGSRDDPATLGGPTVFNHAQYFHAETNPNTTRVDRNIYINSASDGFGMRRSATATQLVAINEPIVGAVGSVSSSYSEQPGGATLTLDDILIVGGGDISTTATRGAGLSSRNLSPSGSYINNVVAFDNPKYNDGTGNDVLYNLTNADGNQQNQFMAMSNIRCHNAYSIAQALYWGTGATPPGTQSQVGITWQNALVDGLTANGSPGAPSNISGTGVRVWTGADYPNPLTRATFITGMGFSSFAAMVNAMAYTPELPWAQACIGVAFPAYGATPKFATASVPSMSGITPDIIYKTALSNLSLSTLNFTRTMASSSTITGCSANFTLSSSDLPDSSTAGVTISSISASGTTTATVTTASAHGLSTGQTITVQGNTPLVFNTANTGPWPVPVTVTSATTFTYQLWTSFTGSATTIGTYTLVPWYIQGTVLNFDGSGTTAISPTIHILETNNDGIAVNTHTTAFTLNITNAPTLSSPSAVGASPTTETLKATTDTGNGTLYMIVSTSATPPSVAQIQAGQDSSGSLALFHTSQAVSASGLQTGTATGLSLSTNYHAYFQHKNSLGNNSTVADSGVFQTKWTPAAIAGGIKLWVENDPTTIYKDAGVTLAVAGTDTIQQWNDKSGAARHLIQTSAGSKPSYAAFGGSNGSLAFNGTSSTMSTSGSAFTDWLDGSGNNWLAAVVYLNNFTNVQDPASLTHPNSPNNLTILRLAAGGANLQTLSYNTIPGANIDVDTALTSGAWYVIMGTVTPTLLQSFINNTGDAGTTISGTRASGGTGLTVGSITGNSNWMNGNLKAVVQGPGTISSGDRTSLYNYLAAL